MGYTLEEGKTELVKVMLKKGSLSFEEISEYSGFSIEEIQKLQAEITG